MRLPHWLTLEGTKRVLALVIVLCFFLPLARCSPQPGRPEAGASAPAQAVASAAPETLVPYENLSFADGGGCFIVLPFFWPLALVAVRRWRRGSRPWLWAANGLEITLALASAWYVAFLGELWGRLAYGGFLALLAYGLHVFASLGDGLRLWRTRSR